ncbi:MAG TPA: hypothetical protein V6D14_27550 [Coleofasciculaceae cyanobacterium]
MRSQKRLHDLLQSAGQVVAGIEEGRGQKKEGTRGECQGDSTP